jgi:putative addiction module CopG family antidote
MNEERKAMTESLEQFVQQQLQSGKYQSYDELVQAGLRLLQEHEEELDRVADALRPALQDYLCGDRGEEVDIDAIKAAGRERLAPSSGL